MPQYSTSVVLDNLQSEEKQLTEFLKNSDGSKKYIEAKYKLEAVQKEIERITLNINNSIGTSKIEKRDEGINLINETIKEQNDYINTLRTSQNNVSSKIVKKLYQWKINDVNRKITKLNKKLGKAMSKQRKCVNKKYIKECKNRNKLAKQEAKQEFYRTLRSELSTFASDLKPNTVKGKIGNSISSTVVSFSSRREGTLQEKINKINSKNKGIKIINENPLFQMLASKNDIYNMDQNQLDEYVRKMNELSATEVFTGMEQIYNQQYQLIKEQQEYLDTNSKSNSKVA